jgi:hypothetical protein
MERLEKTYKMVSVTKPLEIDVQSQVRLFEDVLAKDEFDKDFDESDREKSEPEVEEKPHKTEYVILACYLKPIHRIMFYYFD